MIINMQLSHNNPYNIHKWLQKAINGNLWIIRGHSCLLTYTNFMITWEIQ